MEILESVLLKSSGDLSQTTSTPSSVALDVSTQAVFFEDSGAFDVEIGVFGLVEGVPPPSVSRGCIYR